MLFKSITEIKEYLSVSKDLAFDKIKPYIESAERDFILKLLGKEQYAELQTHYDEPGEDEKLKALLQLVQTALINLAFYRGFSFLSVKISDQGFQRVEGDKFKGLFMNQEKNLKETFKVDGHNSLDRVLEYLEDNIADFEKFKLSANYTIRKNALIPDTATFDAIYDINNSRLVFLKLRRFMKQVEDLDLLPVIGAPLLTRIKTELAKDEPDEKITALVPALREPIAYLSIARGIKELRMNITDNGVFFESKDSTSDDAFKSKAISDNVALVTAEQAGVTGLQYMEILKDILKSTLEDYPEYIGSAPATVRRDNTDKKTIWV